MYKNNEIKKYFEIKIHEGKTHKYEILKPLNEDLNENTSPLLKSSIIDYFSIKQYQTSDVTRHAVDLSNIKNINSHGLTILLVMNRLIRNNDQGNLTLINCDKQIRNLLTMSQLDTVINVKKDISDLL